jgi:hypothetical protein
MGDLPECRVNFEYPFIKTGVDFAGPMNIEYGGPRSKTTSKAYISVFVCMATKAVHLKLVNSMSTKAFFAALDRFFSRRGVAKHIYSDNGTNFVGAANELKSVV